MSWIPIIDNEYVTMKCSPEKKMIHHTFHQPISGRIFRDYLNAGIDTLREFGANKWLSDDRKNSAIPEDDVLWSMKDWGIRAVEAGWEYWAIVVPEDLAGRETMAEFRSHYLAKGVQLQVFISPEDAMAWLETVDAPE